MTNIAVGTTVKASGEIQQNFCEGRIPVLKGQGGSKLLNYYRIQNYNTKATRPVKIDNKIDEENWKEAKQLADVVMKISTFPRGVQEYLDPTKGADHFWTKGVDKKQNAKFSLSHKISLGSFRFYQS